MKLAPVLFILTALTGSLNAHSDDQSLGSCTLRDEMHPGPETCFSSTAEDCEMKNTGTIEAIFSLGSCGDEQN